MSRKNMPPPPPVSSARSDSTLSQFRNNTSHFEDKLAKFQRFVKGREKRHNARDMRDRWMREYGRLQWIEHHLDTQLASQSDTYSEFHQESQFHLKHEKMQLRNRLGMEAGGDTASGSLYHGSATSNKIPPPSTSRNQRDNPWKIRYLARHLEELEREAAKLDEEIREDLVLIKRRDGAFVVKEDHDASEEEPATNNESLSARDGTGRRDDFTATQPTFITAVSYLPNTPIHNLDNLNQQLSDAVSPLSHESYDIRQQFLHLIHDLDQKEILRRQDYKHQKQLDPMDVIWKKNDYYSHYLKLYKQYTTGSAATVRGDKFCKHLLAEIKRRTVFRRRVYGEASGGCDKFSAVPSLDQIKVLDAWYEHRQVMKKRNREQKMTYSQKRSEFLEHMKSTLQLTHEINEETNRRNQERDLYQQRRHELQDKIDELRSEKERQDAIRLEEDECKRLAEQRRAFFQEQEREKLREEMHEAVKRYHEEMEQLHQQKQRHEHMKRQQEELERKRLLPQIKARTDYRSQLHQKKIQERREQNLRMEQEIREREERLELLREQVRPQVEADSDRVMAPTESFLNTADYQETVHSQFPVTGYSDTTLMKDKRFKLQTRLQEAGLLNTQAARDMLNRAAVMEASRMRSDNLTSHQRAMYNR